MVPWALVRRRATREARSGTGRRCLPYMCIFFTAPCAVPRQCPQSILSGMSTTAMSSPVTLPTNGGPRHQRLIRLLRILQLEGSDSLRSQAARLGLSVGQLDAFLAGTTVPDDVARDIEWTMHLPTGWLDGAPGEAPVEEAAG